MSSDMRSVPYLKTRQVTFHLELDLELVNYDLHTGVYCVYIQVSDVQVAYCDSRGPSDDVATFSNDPSTLGEDHVTAGNRIPPPPPPPRASFVLDCQQPLLPHRLPARCIHSNSRDAVV